MPRNQNQVRSAQLWGYPVPKQTAEVEHGYATEKGYHFASGYDILNKL